MFSAEAIAVLRPNALANYSLGFIEMGMALICLAVASFKLGCIALKWNVPVQDSVHALSSGQCWVTNVIPSNRDRLIIGLN
jgi:hypothetical protein